MRNYKNAATVDSASVMSIPYFFHSECDCFLISVEFHLARAEKSFFFTYMERTRARL